MALTIQNIKKIFFCSELAHIYVHVSNNGSPVRLPTIVDQDMTPITKLIYDTLDTPQQERFLKSVAEDELALLLTEAKLDENDPDYFEKMTNGGLGLYMEKYICYHGHCPFCNENTLTKYYSSTTPVVDFVCTNTKYHLKHKKSFMFQLKISTSNIYFNLKNKIIRVGSKRYGELCHSIKGTDTNNFYMVPCYICIKLSNEKEHESYSISSNSFIVEPNYNSSNKPYYHYVESNEFDGPKITWDSSMVTVRNITKIIDTGTFSVRTELYEEPLKNPLCDLRI